MHKNKKHIKKSIDHIFSEGIPPSSEQIALYLTGELIDIEAQQLEAQIANDEFLEDGLEGLQESGAELNKVIHELNDEIAKRTGYKKSAPIVPFFQPNQTQIVLIAAGMLVLISMIVFINWYTGEKEPATTYISDAKTKITSNNKKITQPLSINTDRTRANIDRNYDTVISKDHIAVDSDKNVDQAIEEGDQIKTKKIAQPIQSAEPTTIIEEKKKKDNPKPKNENKTLATPLPANNSKAPAKENAIPSSFNGVPIADNRSLMSSKTNESKSSNTSSSDNVNERDKKVASPSKTKPSFPGGNDALYAYIKNNLQPAAAIGENGIVQIQYKVDKKGKIKDINVIQSVSENADKEAIRIIKSMPKWIPASENGVPIESTTSINVKF